MHSATPELIAFLNSTTQGVSIGLVTLTVRDGTVYRWARSKANVTFGGRTWQAHGNGNPILSWGVARTVAGLTVGDLDVTLQCGESTTIAGMKIPLAATRGYFTGARLLLERAYSASGASIVGVLHRFEGTVQKATAQAGSVVLSVESDLAALNAPFPRALIQPRCSNALFDEACGVSRAAWTYSTACASGSTRSKLYTTTATVPGSNGNHTNGTIAMTSGANDGERRSIKVHSVSGSTVTIDVIPPLPATPAVGDTFTVTTGCAKTMLYCTARFNNLTRFRGMPALPRD